MFTAIQLTIYIRNITSSWRTSCNRTTFGWPWHNVNSCTSCEHSVRRRLMTFTAYSLPVFIWTQRLHKAGEPIHIQLQKITPVMDKNFQIPFRRSGKFTLEHSYILLNRMQTCIYGYGQHKILIHGCLHNNFSTQYQHHPSSQKHSWVFSSI